MYTHTNTHIVTRAHVIYMYMYNKKVIHIQDEKKETSRKKNLKDENLNNYYSRR